MTECGNDFQVRQAPRKRTAEVQVADFTTLVRVPGRPDAVRVYTGAEGDEAASYAAEVGGVVVPLPLTPTADHGRGPDGSLITCE
ncbi:hypothetical protein QRB41_28030 [Mycobacterium avium subsp. hominissuis]|uniref:hypothetical protein n=1 Tax=Mycobacterium avium TaxID=1764 RepID=UPI0009B87C29|nr:hypothetical protein [Mycobacterium avium]MDO2387143.1 hypothetical protein [Mycobacterium avium subsp. hominissuis]